MILGISFGLAAALSQCISYIFSKKYIHRDGTAFQLLIASHLVMGVFATICLGILLLENDLPPFKNYWFELLKVDGFYLLAQMSFFMAISKTEASRLAPLLGLKIIFIALFGLTFFGYHLSFWQWGAVVLCFSGALMSNWSGKSIPLSGVLWLLGAVIGYSLSDINIRQLINCIGVETGKGILNVLIAASVAYFYLGIFSLFIILFTRSVKLKHLKPSLAFSCWWFTAMLFLFACFGFIGPLFGNLVQSGRGIISVILGALIAKFAWSKHEEKLPHSIFIRRIAAALLIAGSIVLFALSGTFNELPVGKIKYNDTLYYGKGAKYIFLLIGDGMGVQQCVVTEKAFNIELSMNTLPVKALVNTSAYGGGITDSAAAVTALGCGKKTQNHVLGIDHKGETVESVATMAKKLGWKIGIVSSVPLNHATPAGFYAHRPKRSMYNEIIQDLAISNFDYFGGGSFIIKNKRQKVLKALKANNYIMIESPEKMPQLDSDKKYIVHSELPYVIDHNKNSGLSLADYTRLGIKHIYTGAGKTKGFFMMVEGGKIDWSGHVNDGGALIHEVRAFDAAVKVALDFYKKHPKLTTVIVTADHETGGLHFLSNAKSAGLLQQKHSYTVMSDKLNKYKKEKLPFEKVLPLLQENYGIKKFSHKELKKLRKAWNAKEAKYNSLLRCMQGIFNERCGLKWSTRGHSASLVALSAIGVGSKIFDAYYENNQIAHKLKSLIKPIAKK